MKRDHRIDDKFPDTKLIQHVHRVELTVHQIRERHILPLVRSDELIYPHIIRPHPEDHRRLVRIEIQLLVRGPVVCDVVLDEPGCLAESDVGDGFGGVVVVTCCSSDGVVPNFERAVETEVEGPLEATVCCGVRL